MPTGANGLPAATIARPSVQRTMSSGRASVLSLGFDNGKMIGRSTCAATRRINASGKLPPCPDAPINTVGLNFDRRRRGCAALHCRDRRLSPAPATTRARVLYSSRISLSATMSPRLSSTAMRCADLRVVEPDLRQPRADLPSDAEPARARAEHDDAFVAEFVADHATRAEQPRQRDRTGALDVVVERRQHLPVLVHDRQRVFLAEVFPLQHRAGKFRLHRQHELVDRARRIRRRAAADGGAEIQRIVEQCLVVGSDVELIGSVSAGCMPAAAVYNDNLPIEMPMPPAPWSPMPRIDSLSVTTISRMRRLVCRVAQRSARCGRARRRDPHAARMLEHVAEIARAPGRPSACR